MTPEAATREQIRRYRQMTGEQRLTIALELHELSCNIAREAIRAQNPGANDALVEEKLHARIRKGYELDGLLDGGTPPKTT